MKKTVGSLAAMILMATTVLSGCGSGSDQKQQSAAATSAVDSSKGESGAAGEKSPKGKKVAFPLMGLGFEFMVMLNDSAKEVADKYGMDVKVFDANVDANKQAEQMQSIIATQPDAILLSSVDGELIVPSIDAARKKNIPVFGVESKILGGDYLTWVGYDNYKAGVMAADYIAKAVGDAKGTVLEQRGLVGATGADLRSSGFNDQMEKYPNLKVVTLNNEWVADKAFSNTLDAFTAHKDIVATFSANDEMLRGVVSALKKLGRDKKVGENGHIVMIGVDGTPTGLQRIREGVQDASLNQDAKAMGSEGMERVAKYFSGETRFERDTMIPPSIIDKNNVDDPNLWGNIMAQKSKK
ncbi:sugar ABC transporter substrate-binding protein [Paenibacillus sp. tmac-D7]|uniref:sugar ABC transporter substrate-binding protein n=1 Tax=Paenibacillus sp. tmac-D7 TaxID=2591462 RepID=UPI0011419154|nr:sugar ABC transporter substrate-binding protein [Paenibacillus sp. tmac-D7]